MKVALVWNGPGTVAERGVLARRELPLLRLLAAQGIDVTVLLLGDRTGLAAVLRGASVDVQVLPTALPPRPASLARVPEVAVRLRGIIDRLDPDVVEGDDVMPAIATGIAARSRRRGVIVYRRHHAAERVPLLVASRVAARLAHRTLVSCEAMRRRAAHEDRVPLARIEVTTSGAAERRPVAPAEVMAARRVLGVGDGARVIGVVSRLRRQKGLDVLLAALAYLGDLHDVHLCIVGDGAEEPALRRLAAHAPVPVHFVGYREDAQPWIAMSQVIVMPSRCESLGRVTLETMAAARPLVATRVDGLADAVLDGVTGLLVPPEDPCALAAALRTLLDDPALARRLGDAARARYETRYTLAHMAAGWREGWERALCAGGA